MKVVARLRATPERWYFKVVTNNGNSRIETIGPIDAVRGECLRVLQIHIGRLTEEETKSLVELTQSMVESRKRAEAK